MVDKKCLDSLAQEGGVAKEVADEMESAFEDVGRIIGDREWQGRAAARLQAEIERTIGRKKRQRVKQGLRNAEHKARIDGSGDKAHKAARSIFTFDATGEMAGPNVAIRQEAIRGQAFGVITDFMDKFRQGVGGVTQGRRVAARNKAGIKDVLRGLFGEEVNPEAKAFADAVSSARTMLIRRFNAAGGDVVERKDFGWVHSHEVAKMGNKAQWLDDIVPLLDKNKMFDSAGFPLRDENQVRDMAEAAYDSIIKNEKDDFGSSIDGRTGHRALSFKNADAYLAYQDKYGSDDFFGSVVGEMEKLSRDVAVMEVLGPNPHGALRAMKALAGEGKATEISLDNLFDEVIGANDPFIKSGWAGAAHHNRNLLTAARLGSAMLTSVGDFATMGATMMSNGGGRRLGRVLGRHLKQMNPASAKDRRLAARMNYISEGWLGQGLATQRIQGEAQRSGISANLSDQVLRKSGLSGFTEAGRNAFSLEMTGFLTDLKGTKFADMNAGVRDMMERYGVTEADWNKYRATKQWKDHETKATFIRPDQVKDHIVGQKFDEMIRTESYFAVVRPTATSKVLARAGSKRGSAASELFWKNAALWKSFAISMVHLHLMRTFGIARRRGGLRGGAYAAGFVGGLPAMGAVAYQLSNISKGKDPEDMTTPAFWGKALIKGGGLGLAGDMIDGLVRGNTEVIGETLAGPVFGSQGNALLSALRDPVANEKTGSGTRRLLEMMTPGTNLWYGRLATERLALDRVQDMLAPQGRRALQQKERRARRDGQSYWWKPGKREPSRAPKLGAATGRRRSSGIQAPTIGAPKGGRKAI